MDIALSASDIGSITGLNMEKLRVWRHRGYSLPKARAVFSFQDAVVFACLAKMLDHGFPPAEAADMLHRLDVWRTAALDQEHEDAGLPVNDMVIGFVVATLSNGDKVMDYVKGSRPEELFAELNASHVLTVINVTAIRREVAAKIKARA